MAYKIKSKFKIGNKKKGYLIIDEETLKKLDLTGRRDLNIIEIK